MDVQQAFLSKVIRGSAMQHVVTSRVTPEFFTDERYRRIYEYMLDHWRKYNEPPDLAVVNRAFPSYDWPEYPQSLDYFIDALRERRHESILLASMEEAARKFNESDNPERLREIDTIMQQALLQVHLETQPTRTMGYGSAREQFLMTMDELMLNPGYLRGISSGFRGIDYVTGGWQPQQFVVLMGLPKALKSSTLLYMARAAHRQAEIPLFLGFEMTNDEQLQRLVSLEAQVALTKILTGNVNFVEYRRIEKALRAAEDMRPFLFSDDISNATTVSGVQALIQETQPTVVFIDAAYLMQSELPKVEQQSAAALTDIARNLKKLAQSMEIPIVVTTQATQTRTSGGKLRADSAMYTQAWRQSADVLLGVERTNPEEDDTGEVTITVKVLASRSGPRAETTMVWDWSHGVVSELDLDQWRHKRAVASDGDA